MFSGKYRHMELKSDFNIYVSQINIYNLKLVNVGKFMCIILLNWISISDICAISV